MSRVHYRFVEWMNAHCTLRFKTSQPAGESFELSEILRIREPITRTKKIFRAKVPGPEIGDVRRCESRNEKKGAVIITASAHADLVKMQPLLLIYKADGKIRKYYPDILLVWGMERCIVEIKDDRKANDPQEKARYEYMGSLLATHGFDFRLWKKSEIKEQPRYDNALEVYRYLRCPVSPIQRELLRSKFQANPLIEIGFLNDNEIRCVFRLVMDGELHIDWTTRLKRSSWVSTTPFPGQSWPILHHQLSEHNRK